MSASRSVDEELALLREQHAQFKKTAAQREMGLVARAEQQEARADDLANQLILVSSEREHYQEMYNDMLVRCKKLERGIIAGNAAERAPKQLAEMQTSMALLELMFGALEEPTADSPERAPGPDDDSPKPRPRAPRHGRRPLPQTLPRIEIEILPDEVIAAGVDNFERIGQDTTEILERRTASLVVVGIIRPKFVRKDRPRNDVTDIYIAPTVAQPIERGLAGPNLLADTIVKRWHDHMPLSRQEQMWAREGVELAKSTMCAWHASLANLCAPLIRSMWNDARTAPYLCTDATGLLVRAPDKCRKGHFWVVIAPRRHVLYQYSTSHNMAAVDAMLGDYAGFLVADAHNVYDHLYRNGKVVEVACWA